MRAFRPLVSILLAAALPAGLQGGFGQLVALSSTARPDYIRPVDESGRPAAQTYVFSPGRFFGGSTRDRSLERIGFMEVARTLAPNLAQQNYFPTKDVAAADLTIIVHWGVTTTYLDPQTTFNAADLTRALSEMNAGVARQGVADSSAVNALIDQGAMSQSTAMGAINFNAALLGYARDLKKVRAYVLPTAEEISLSMELNEERYFVVLMAYDNQYRLKEHRARLLWVTRLSMRSPGNNFTESLPALGLAGSRVFGRALDGLVHVEAASKAGKVTLGEMKVIGVDVPAPPGKESK